ncbi:Phosphatidylinositol 4-phosphate 5-kinase 8 [Chlorella vulgaris]
MAEEAPTGLPQRTKQVGKAGNAGVYSPGDPQWWLADTHHPYAPFAGNALKWESYAYDDGTTYEGLMLNNIPHNKGILVFGNGLGGGIQKADRGDRYEGEFQSGFVHGMGQYTSTKGSVYRGEYTAGLRHGCGVEYDTKPFISRVEAGMDPDAAWAEAQPEVERSARRGTWLKDTFFTGPDDSGRWCHIAEIKGTEQEVESVVNKARMFQFKPDGEVTMRFMQDGNGMPAPLMQDPLHYPHGTKFLAPGPLGQCHPIPDVESLKDAMISAANAHSRIHQSYNLPYDPPAPGSTMDKAMKLWRKKEGRKQRTLDKKLQREQQRIRRMEAADAAAAGAGKPKEKAAAPKQQKVEAEDDEGPPSDVDDDDLIASTAGMEEQQKHGGGQQQQQAGAGFGGPFQPPTVLANVSLGLSRATRLLHRAFHEAAVRAPARRSLTRPSWKSQ